MASANLLGFYYQKLSKLDFTESDKDIEIHCRKIAHGCRNSEHGNPNFTDNFTMQEMKLTFTTLDSLKSAGPDNIYGLMMILNLRDGESGDCCNSSTGLGDMEDFGVIGK